MKKVKLVAVILIVCLMVALFTACDEIIKKNDYRDFHQVVATVSYTTTINGKTSTQSKDILKGDLKASYASYGNVYVNYYGMSPAEATEKLLNQLYQREALIMFAKAYLIKNGIVTNIKMPEAGEIKDFLTIKEQNKAIRATNKDMEETLDKILTDLISDDEANKAVEKKEEEKKPIKDAKAVSVYFESNGGSNVDTQRVLQGMTVKEPTAPKREGFTFGGWFVVNNGVEEKYDFEKAVMEKFTLTAKWYTYIAPREVMPKVEEEVEDSETELSLHFFEKVNLDKLTFKDMESGYSEEKYKEFLNDGIDSLLAKLKKDYRDYDFFLEQQMATVLLEKFKKAIEDTQTVSQAEIDAEYLKMIDQNKKQFEKGENEYEESLKKDLNNTLYHAYIGNDNTYGFVNNILLKFNEDELKQLTDYVSAGIATVEQLKEFRDNLAHSHKVKISNPKYDKKGKCPNGFTVSGENCDPMTCPEHACNSSTDKNLLDKDGNETTNGYRYNSLITFSVVDGEGKIEYGVEECPLMAYLKTEWPAYTEGEKIGVVNQFENTMSSVDAQVSGGSLTKIQGLYWKQEIAKAWLYLVGDDGGSVKTESNNGGLGYLVKPKEVGESGFIGEFEDAAREVIESGTGSYKVVVGDNFIDEGTNSSSYCGIFIIFASDVPYDITNYSLYGAGTIGEGKLPQDYVVGYDEKEGKTVKDIVKEKIEADKKKAAYDKITNDYVNGNSYSVSKDEKIIKQVYGD